MYEKNKESELILRVAVSFWFLLSIESKCMVSFFVNIGAVIVVIIEVINDANYQMLHVSLGCRFEAKLDDFKVYFLQWWLASTPKDS